MHIRILAGKLDRQAGSHVYHHHLATRLAARGHHVSLIFFESEHAPLRSIETIAIPSTSYEQAAALWRINPILRYLHCARTLRRSHTSRPDIVIGGEHLLLRPHHRVHPDVPWIYLPHSLTVEDEISHYHLECTLHAVTISLYKHLQTWALQNASCTLRFTTIGCDYLRSAYRRVDLSRFVVNPIGIDAPKQTARGVRGPQVRLLLM